MLMDLKQKVRTIPDFPKKGILFYDITTILKDNEAFKSSIDSLYEYAKKKNVEKVVGIESRGFIFGSVIAYLLNVGFVPVRKFGKLPAETLKADYGLEYGKDAIEIHSDAISRNEKVLIVDDLLATGGTAKAVAELIEKLGGKVEGFAFLIELSFLKGREKLKNYEIFSLMDFDK